MRTIKVGKFDSAITIYNAIGHLTKADFEKALRNIGRNLNWSGLYIFDIDNRNMNYKSSNARDIDATWMVGKATIHKIQKCKLNRRTGMLAMRDLLTIRKGSSKPEMLSKTRWTMQLYSAEELREILARNGFEVLEQIGMDGSKFSDRNTPNILTIAQKR